MRSFSMTIDGELSEAASGDRFESYNPYTAAQWATIPDGDGIDVDRAVAAARAAADAWRRTPGLERARLLHRFADALEEEAAELAALESTDNGKVLRETSAQVGFAARNFRFFAGYADKLFGSTIPLDRPDAFDYTIREPFGVAALITAWNSPISLAANKLPPALATGNVVVLKPSEQASATTCELGRIATEVGFPAGVLNVVTGGSVVGAALVGHPGVNKISVTGGLSTGSAVAHAAADRVVPLTLELGGKSANIIFEDADLARAVPGAIAGIFAAAGQTCIAGSRLLVHRSKYDAVVQAVAARAASIVLGDPLDVATEMGPMNNQAQLDHALRMVADAIADGARLVVGGNRADVSGPGWFMQPTVFADVTPSMRLAREEVFGPVLAVLPFDDDDEAIAIANGTDFGLAAGVWTTNVAHAHRVASVLRSGVVWINTYRATAAQAPFGGVDRSGYGREHGVAALDDYTFVKNVYLDLSQDARDPFSIRT